MKTLWVAALIAGFVPLTAAAVNGLNLIGTSPFVQQIVIGVVIVLAVMVDANKRRSR